MTREEAIICKIYLEDLDKHHTCNEYKLLMGLLEQEPCEDAISRQEALDCFTATKLKKFDFILYAREEIKKLPPVQPKQTECEDCISREAAINIIYDYEYKKDMRKALEGLPSVHPKQTECDDAISRQAVWNVM